MGETRRRRGALIGLGNVAVHGHLPGWQARRDSEIVAATDASPARQAECRARLPAARWHDSVESLLAGPARGPGGWDGRGSSLLLSSVGQWRIGRWTGRSGAQPESAG